MKGICFAVLLGSCLGMPYVSSAGETNARDYLPAPSGTSIVLTYAKHITADSIYTDDHETDGFNYTQNVRGNLKNIFRLPLTFNDARHYRCPLKKDPVKPF